MKYYAVKQGRIPGIYTDWDSCQKQINGFSGAIYKSFKSEDEAYAFAGLKKEENVAENVSKNTTKNETNTNKTNKESGVIHAYVDGSYSSNMPGVYSYGVILLENDTVIDELSGKEDYPELASMNNVAGEIRAAEEAVKWCLEKDYKSLIIYHDNEGVANWVTGAWKATKTGTKKYKEFMLSAKTQLNIEFVHVKAHSGILYNEKVDKLAKKSLGMA